LLSLLILYPAPVNFFFCLFIFKNSVKWFRKCVFKLFCNFATGFRNICARAGSTRTDEKASLLCFKSVSAPTRVSTVLTCPISCFLKNGAILKKYAILKKLRHLEKITPSWKNYAILEKLRHLRKMAPSWKMGKNKCASLGKW